ncbi:hypothetical protein, partial [Burkholderia ubonensis]|uniref:hypothetical protein n=1 Tax=Burkholderia ubonensis TaxID=101571 RepID=UPI001E3AE368
MPIDLTHQLVSVRYYALMDSSVKRAFLLRFTKSMTTDSLPTRYTVITLNGDSVDGQNGRSYTQADAC